MRTAKKEANPLVNELIRLFSEVNPAAVTWYANKTQRAAAERLLEAHGLEKLQKVIALLSKTNETPYFPRIVSPYDLEQKWVSLVSAFERRKREPELKGRGIA